MPVPHNYHDRGIHGPMYHDHGPLHSHHYLPHPHTYHVPPCPPPHPHVDICVPYDDTALWMAIERLQQELDDEIQARKDADDALQAEIDDLQDQIDDLQKQIDDIDTEIDNIYSVLEEMLSESTSSKTLDEGTDYTLTFYNGYKIDTDSGPNDTIHVSRKQTTLKSRTKKYTTTTIIVAANANYWLTNSRSLSQSSQPSSGSNYPMFRHSSVINDSSDERSMYSRICRVTLLNDYGDCTNTDDSNGRVWNMSPSSKRASWIVNPYISHITNGSHDALLIGATQISDGYNTQYYTAYSPTLTYGLLNLHVEATFVKSEDL